MNKVSDLQIGVAGEYLVCADLILKGHRAFLSEQGLPFDVILDYKGKLYKCQVKTTREHREVPQRKNPIPAYIFNIGRNGKANRWGNYSDSDVDFFALVAIDSNRIAYLPNKRIRSTMNFRVPEFRGQYHDEQGAINKKLVTDYKKQGKSIDEIVNLTGLKKSNVYKYSANVSIEQKGTNSGVYFDEFPLDKCLKEI